MRLWTFLNNPSPTQAEVQESARIQAVLSRADAAAVPGGVRGMSKTCTTCVIATVPILTSNRIRFEQIAWLWNRTSPTTPPSEGCRGSIIHGGTSGNVGIGRGTTELIESTST